MKIFMFTKLRDYYITQSAELTSAIILAVWAVSLSVGAVSGYANIFGLVVAIDGLFSLLFGVTAVIQAFGLVFDTIKISSIDSPGLSGRVQNEIRVNMPPRLLKVATRRVRQLGAALALMSYCIILLGFALYAPRAYLHWVTYLWMIGVNVYVFTQQRHRK